jgi:hypothetical protein
MWNSPFLRGTRGIVLLNSWVWKDVNGWALEIGISCTYSNPVVTGGWKKNTHTLRWLHIDCQLLHTKIRTPLGSESLSLNIEQIFVRPSVCPFVHSFVRLSVRPHGITVSLYIRIHFWDALLIKFVKILGLDLVWNYFPRFYWLYWLLRLGWNKKSDVRKESFVSRKLHNAVSFEEWVTFEYIICIKFLPM